MPGPGGANNGVGRTPPPLRCRRAWGGGGDSPWWGVPPSSQPRPVCVTGWLIRAHCSLSWESEGKDGSGCANLTGESGGGVVGEKGVSERLFLRCGAAVRGCDRRNRSPPPREPTSPGLGFRCAVNPRQWRWAERGRAKRRRCYVRCVNGVAARRGGGFSLSRRFHCQFRGCYCATRRVRPARPPARKRCMCGAVIAASAGREEMRWQSKVGVRAAVKKKAEGRRTAGGGRGGARRARAARRCR